MHLNIVGGWISVSFKGKGCPAAQRLPDSHGTAGMMETWKGCRHHRVLSSRARLWVQYMLWGGDVYLPLYNMNGWSGDWFISISALQFPRSLHGFPLFPLAGCDLQGPWAHDVVVGTVLALIKCYSHSSLCHSFTAVAQKCLLVSPP